MFVMVLFFLSVEKIKIPIIKKKKNTSRNLHFDVLFPNHSTYYFE